MKKINRRLTIGAVTLFAAAGLGFAGASAAQAAPLFVQPHPAVGSASICIDLPVGSADVDICF
ncbi:hypothetical protein [Gordonia aurantiaca]|uniref:hypothetical protein n=1 Tax=Gordonia sp. B21 TaxID=3151852 RepID=UPI0032654F05